ncbi:MAG: HRDC domain-containing protein [Planctomycetaceae bacterium]|nr:HRDC domain-containing protein [Planctomycetaceae bacterium]
MSSSLITKQSDFDNLCKRLKDAPAVAFDTEFVSEHTFRSRLCLLQFATEDETVAVDSLEVEDLTAWWEIMANEQTPVIVHGGREEILFCWYAIQKPPANLVDVQIVQGMLSRGFPLSHSAIVQKVANAKIHGRETRTDWGRRPLTPKQIEYALEDVLYLIQIDQKQKRQLKKTNRTAWAQEEGNDFINSLIRSQQQRNDAWVKLPKVSRLSRSELAIARALFRWREVTGEKLDRPVRTVLRDDLLVEIAHRRPTSEAEILSSRDMQRSSYKRHVTDLLKVIQETMELPESEYPAKIRTHRPENTKHDEQVLGKLLSIALANRCAECDLSPAMMGTANDLRDFVSWHFSNKDKQDSLPRLASGWRYEICGELLEDLLDGRVSLRVKDASSDHPLVFERVEDR